MNTVSQYTFKYIKGVEQKRVEVSEKDPLPVKLLDGTGDTTSGGATMTGHGRSFRVLVAADLTNNTSVDLQFPYEGGYRLYLQKPSNAQRFHGQFVRVQAVPNTEEAAGNLELQFEFFLGVPDARGWLTLDPNDLRMVTTSVFVAVPKLLATEPLQVVPFQVTGLLHYVGLRAKVIWRPDSGTTPIAKTHAFFNACFGF